MMSESRRVAELQEEALRESLVGASAAKLARVAANAPRVTMAEFDAAEFFTPSDPNDKVQYVFVETPAAEMRQIEEETGLESGFFTTPYVVKTTRADCPDCGRKVSFLDVVPTGLRVHRPEFMCNKVFRGGFEKVLNTRTHQRCFCKDCGALQPAEATKFAALRPPMTEAEGGPAPGYLWNIYTHKLRRSAGAAHHGPSVAHVQLWRRLSALQEGRRGGGR